MELDPSAPTWLALHRLECSFDVDVDASFPPSVPPHAGPIRDTDSAERLGDTRNPVPKLFPVEASMTAKGVVLRELLQGSTGGRPPYLNLYSYPWLDGGDATPQFVAVCVDKTASRACILGGGCLGAVRADLGVVVVAPARHTSAPPRPRSAPRARARRDCFLTVSCADRRCCYRTEEWFQKDVDDSSLRLSFCGNECFL